MRQTVPQEPSKRVPPSHSKGLNLHGPGRPVLNLAALEADELVQQHRGHRLCWAGRAEKHPLAALHRPESYHLLEEWRLLPVLFYLISSNEMQPLLTREPPVQTASCCSKSGPSFAGQEETGRAADPRQSRFLLSLSMFLTTTQLLSVECCYRWPREATTASGG